jgi:hypothetical protein
MTGTSLTNPLQALLTRAAATPADTGESARYKARYQQTGAHVILCDVSSSMREAAGAHTRIWHLRAALDQVATPDHTLIAFASHVTPMRGPADLPQPSGGTMLDLGLAAAARHDPRATLVISDGEPNDAAAALEVARGMPGRIDVIYCGDENNHAAMQFMRDLARAGAGRVVVHHWDMLRPVSLGHTVRLLLEGPGA